MESVGVREIRQNVSAYLRRVEEGETFQVTDRGRPVAVLSGTEEALRSGVAGLIEQLVAAGVYRDLEDALADGVDTLARRLRRELVDRATVEGYRRVPSEPDPWIEEAAAAAARELEPW